MTNSFPDWFVWALIAWIVALTCAVLYYQKRDKYWYKNWSVAQDGWSESNVTAAELMLELDQVRKEIHIESERNKTLDESTVSKLKDIIRRGGRYER